MGKSRKTSRTSCDSDAGESSTTGISSRNLGCFSFLSLPTSLGLLRGFSKVDERQVLAWSMASSFEVGGVDEVRTSGRIWDYGAELEKRRNEYGNGKVVDANEMEETGSGLWSEKMGLKASQFQWLVDES